jgi:hypothetical protein
VNPASTELPARGRTGGRWFIAATATVGTVLPLALPLRPALAAGLAVIVLAAFCCRAGAELRRRRRDVNVKQQATALLAAPVLPSAARIGDERRMCHVGEALAGGFPDSAVEEAIEVAAIAGIPAAERLAMLRMVDNWLRENEGQHSAARQFTFDVVFISDFSLPGGNAATMVAEIRICRDQNLKVGLLRHPVFRQGPNEALDPRVEELVDGESVSLIGLDDVVECELAVVRPPAALMKPVEQRPSISAGNTIVVVDRAPFAYCGPAGTRERLWDIATVDRHVTDWLGRPTWYAGGPAVRQALFEHHAEEVAEIDMAFLVWNEAIEVGKWRLDGERVPDGRIRIGRHSCGDVLKWPEDPGTLRRCYPGRDPFEIHVLEGAASSTCKLGDLPANWTVHPFGSMSAKEFLGQIDVMVYFVASDGVEVFGRETLEAMAAGVPVIMDRRFEPTFGPAAIYCEPSEVAAVAARLTADPDAYAAQRSAASDHVAEHFSGWALVERLAQCTRGGRLREALEFSPAEYWDRRYRAGKDSGEGSRAERGSFKAQYVSALIKERQIASVVDWGCGDGQVFEKIDLHGATYTGLDVSLTVIERQRAQFSGRPECRFELPDGYDRRNRSDLALSMDVLVHLPGDEDYHDYLSNLFDSAERFVLVYSTDRPSGRTAGHVRRRKFSADIAERFPEWELTRFEPPLDESLASFFLYERQCLSGSQGLSGESGRAPSMAVSTSP